MKEVIDALWQAMDAQRWEALTGYFSEDAVIRWPNTNEVFTVADFVAANSEYPGDWRIVVEESTDAHSVIRTEFAGEAFRAVSFFRFADGKITKLTEYWGDIGKPPQWRTDKGIGKAERSSSCIS